MFIKLAWELDYLKKAIGEQLSVHRGHEFASYHAFNVAITAWHISDWVWNYISEEQRRSLASSMWFDISGNHQDNIRKFQVAIRSKSRALAICWDICNGSKHFDTHKDSKVDAKVDFESKEARAGDFRVGSSINETLSYDFLINWENQTFKAVDVFEEARNFWHAILAELKLAGSIYVEMDFDVKIVRKPPSAKY